MNLNEIKAGIKNNDTDDFMIDIASLYPNIIKNKMNCPVCNIPINGKKLNKHLKSKLCEREHRKKARIIIESGELIHLHKVTDQYIIALSEFQAYKVLEMCNYNIQDTIKFLNDKYNEYKDNDEKKKKILRNL